MNTELVSLTVDADGIAVVRMNDEEGRNALSEEMATSLQRLFSQAGTREDVKVMVIAGLPDYFSTGATRALLERIVDKNISPSDILLPRSILSLPIPVIAAMEGHAIGGGLALGICADLILISQESRYGCSFMNMGFTPGMGTTRLLEHVVSPAIAHEMLFAGQAFRGSDLKGRTAFNYILPRGQVFPKAMELASRISEKTRFSLTLLKENLARHRRMVYEDALLDETRMHQATFNQPDIAERIRKQFESI